MGWNHGYDKARRDAIEEAREDAAMRETYKTKI